MNIKKKQKTNLVSNVTPKEQDYIPVEKIEYGIIKQTDGKYVKILEVENCEYTNLTPDRQWAMVDAFTNIYENSCISLHIKIKSSTEDLSVFFNNVHNEQADDPNPFVQERREDYIKTSQAFVAS